MWKGFRTLDKDLWKGPKLCMMGFIKCFWRSSWWKRFEQSFSLAELVKPWCDSAIRSHWEAESDTGETHEGWAGDPNEGDQPGWSGKAVFSKRAEVHLCWTCGSLWGDRDSRVTAALASTVAVKKRRRRRISETLSAVWIQSSSQKIRTKL